MTEFTARQRENIELEQVAPRPSKVVEEEIMPEEDQEAYKRKPKEVKETVEEENKLKMGKAKVL